MERQEIALLAAAGEGVGSGIAPHIAAISAILAELDVVAVPAAAVLEHKHKLVLAAVERAHPAIVLDPDTEVFVPNYNCNLILQHRNNSVAPSQHDHPS
jgi:hypothetical protein